MPNLGVYIPDQLNMRLQRLRDKGVELNASNVFRQALEGAVEVEEKALGGDRVARLVARLRTARTPMEAARADGEAAGAQWAEETAAYSELRDTKDLLKRLESEGLDVIRLDLGSRVALELGKWDNGAHDMIPLGDVVQLPDSVPADFFKRAQEPYHKGVHYTSPLVFAFMHGAVDVLNVFEKAMVEDKYGPISAETAQVVGFSLGAGGRTTSQRKKASTKAGAMSAKTGRSSGRGDSKPHRKGGGS